MKRGRTSLFYDSPIGILKISGDAIYIHEVIFLKEGTDHSSLGNHVELLKKCALQLDEYFRGKRKVFHLPLLLDGTAFQKKVWQELEKIPYGKTLAYSDIAAMVGNPRAVRAVGGANNRNPVSIIVPCHRVIGKDGTLTGYGGGLWRKEWLLEHEKQNI